MAAAHSPTGVRRPALARGPAALVVAAVAMTVVAAVLLAGPARPSTATAADPSDAATLAAALPAAAPPVTYRLPFPAGTSALVTQGNAGPFTHRRRGFSEYAWDFAMPVGSMVAAAADGTVAAVEHGYSAGGTESTYRSRSNHVVIAHADGRYSVYLHLAYRGSLVTLGQRVRAGQAIALSGATGYTTGPHLHFQVQETPNVGRSWSVPLTFADAGVPALGDAPVSGNAFVPSDVAPRAADAGLAFAGSEAALSGPLYTYQKLPVSLRWGRPLGPAADTPARVVMADGEGRRTTIVSDAPAGMREPDGTVAAEVAGPVTVWAEYRDGTSWIVVPTVSGSLVTYTTEALESAVFIAEPGLAVEQTEPGVYSLSFAVVDLSPDAHRLRGLAVKVTPPPGAPPVAVPPTIKDVYLRPGSTRTWRGTVSLATPGVYTISPWATDSAGHELSLPPEQVGLPTTASVTVEGEPPPPIVQTFADVPPAHPAFAAVERLAAHGLVDGYPGPGGSVLFRPDEPVTRAQFAKLVVSAVGLPVSETDVCPFVDVDVSGPDRLFPDNYVAVAAAAGITRGTSLDPPRFSPDSPVTRAQASTMARRADPRPAGTIPGDPAAPATRAETAVLVAGLLP